jgi:hypothetical protein
MNHAPNHEHHLSSCPHASLQAAQNSSNTFDSFIRGHSSTGNLGLQIIDDLGFNVREPPRLISSLLLLIKLFP